MNQDEIEKIRTQLTSTKNVLDRLADELAFLNNLLDSQRSPTLREAVAPKQGLAVIPCYVVPHVYIDGFCAHCGQPQNAKP